MKALPAEQRRAAAFHEAGHAVVCIEEGLELDIASLVRDDDTLGVQLHSTPLSGLELESLPEDRDLVERAGRVFLAGARAQRRAAPDSGWRTADERSPLRQLLARFRPDLRSQRAWIALLSAEADRVLDDLWPVVEAVAAALLEQHALTGEQVRAVYETTHPRRLRPPAATALRAAAETKKGRNAIAVLGTVRRLAQVHTQGGDEQAMAVAWERLRIALNFLDGKDPYADEERLVGTVANGVRT